MIYTVFVKPNSKKGPLVVETNSGDPDATHELTVYLREKPVDGAANAALIAILAKHFHIAKSQISIKTGSRGRHKLVEID